MRCDSPRSILTREKKRKRRKSKSDFHAVISFDSTFSIITELNPVVLTLSFSSPLQAFVRGNVPELQSINTPPVYIYLYILFENWDTRLKTLNAPNLRKKKKHRNLATAPIAIGVHSRSKRHPIEFSSPKILGRLRLSVTASPFPEFAATRGPSFPPLPLLNSGTLFLVNLVAREREGKEVTVEFIRPGLTLYLRCAVP